MAFGQAFLIFKNMKIDDMFTFLQYRVSLKKEGFYDVKVKENHPVSFKCLYFDL